MFIVTGGAGFIGSAFVSKLNQQGIDDILIVDNLGSSDKWKNLRGKSFSQYLHKDRFFELLQTNQIPRDISAIIHMGACSSTTVRDADYILSNNFEYTKKLAELALDRDVRFIYASSGATYGNGAKGYSDDDQVMQSLEPLNLYGFSKQLFDLWASQNGFLDKIVGLKFFNVFGPNEYHKGDMRSVVNKAFHHLNEHGNVKLFRSYHPEYADGESKRDFVYIKDCIEMMWWLLENPDTNGIFNVGTGSARSWNDLAKALFKALDREPNIEYIDMPENLQGQYQYFTEATMDKLKNTGCPTSTMSLEDAVADYVQNYLVSDSYF